MDDYLTVAEAAKLLKVSKDKVYELAKIPGFPSFPLGRSIRIIKADLFKWTASQAGQ